MNTEWEGLRAVFRGKITDVICRNRRQPIKKELRIVGSATTELTCPVTDPISNLTNDHI
jgi:hypothetical protein